MGRIHRYGQEKDCLIFNFVSTNTREGRVLHKLLSASRPSKMTSTPSAPAKCLMSSATCSRESVGKDVRTCTPTTRWMKNSSNNALVEQVDTKRLESITNSTLEGLAKRELESVRHHRQIG